MFSALLNLSDNQINWVTAAPGDSLAVRRRKSRLLALAIKPLLEAQVLNDMLFLESHRIPPLYTSGVVYREEPPTIVTFSDGTVRKVEEFASLPIVLARGWGDCDDLAPARTAELRSQGERASIRIIWKQPFPTSQKVYHVLVRRPRFAVKDFDPRFMAITKDGGSVIEDPSMRLGMPSTIKSLRESANLT